ncbi:MAG: glycosyltransferase family 4 protein [Candidatus Brocadiaceae bacterium]|nr:glycosyltransferase family 4 protein [Candidatus Brocadiaceae bacterium]
MGTPPVRVCHVITRMILGGAQENTLHTCHGLQQRGWDVLLITGPPIGPEGELLSTVRRLGIPCAVVPALRRPIAPLRDARAFVELVRLLRWFGPAIVQTHSSKAGILGRFAARAANVPVIVHTIEGLPFHRYAPRALNAAYIRAERQAARVTDHIVCVARAMQDQAVRAGIRPRGGYSLIYSGLDVASHLRAAPLRAAARRRLGIAPADVVIGKVARLFDLKGHEFVIRALPAVLARCPQARCLFVGDGPLRIELARLAGQLGVAHRVSFAGLVSPEEVPATISAMDVLVHASLREGLPRVLVQGLLCEKPVVAFALDGAPEVILDGITGRLVEPESVQGLADALLEAVEHPEQALRMAREGRRRFAGRFSIDTMVHATEALYRDLLARRP